MSPISWISLAAVLAAAVSYAVWIYARRELPVSGGRLLAATRAVVLCLILLLVWNPRLPDASPAAGPDAGTVLVDGSASMGALGTDGSTAWASARAEARRLAGADGRVIVFGDAVVPTTVDALDSLAPRAPASRLLPALRAAAESGVPAVTVITDRRLENGDLATLQAGLGLDVTVVPVGGELRNAGVLELETPAQVSRDEGFEVEVSVFGESPAAGDSALVEVREEGRLVASAAVVLPGPGRVVRTTVGLPPPETEGVVRYSARVVLADDGYADDDQRIRFVLVDEEETGLALLSLRPDWEPRYVLPVLEEVTGLPVRGYLRMAGPRYLPMTRGADAGEPLSEAELRGALSNAQVLVLHGVDAEAPTWIAELVRGAPRVLVFPRDREGAAHLGVAAGSGLQGEWYVSPDLPPSPVARELAGLDLNTLPPLTQLQPLTNSADGLVPLRVQLGGRGPGEAALLLGSDGARRWGVVLASGFWRWAFREGAPSRAYRSLWAGVADWLLASAPLVAGSGVRPVTRVLTATGGIDWVAPGLAGDSLTVRVLRGDSVVVDSSLVVSGEEAFRTPSVAPGAYTYTAVGPAGNELGADRFDVESFTDELFRAPRTDEGAGEGEADGLARTREGRPLRTHPAPFLLVLALLCGEWIGRRRRGLR